MLRSKLRQNRRSQTAAARKNFSQRGEAFPCPDRDFLATVSSAAAPDYSRYATSITETGPVHVLGVLAEERFAAASTAVIARDATSAELPGRRARLIGLAGQPETGQRHSYKAAGESFQGLPPRCGPGQTFGQLIEFVAHNFSPFLLGSGPEHMMHEP